MAGKKGKMKPMKAKMDECCECCCDDGFYKLEIWILVLLGAVGLLSALNVLGFGTFGLYFQYVWSVLVLVIGLSRLMKTS